MGKFEEELLASELDRQQGQDERHRPQRRNVNEQATAVAGSSSSSSSSRESQTRRDSNSASASEPAARRLFDSGRDSQVNSTGATSSRGDSETNHRGNGNRNTNSRDANANTNGGHHDGKTGQRDPCTARCINGHTCTLDSQLLCRPGCTGCCERPGVFILACGHYVCECCHLDGLLECSSCSSSRSASVAGNSPSPSVSVNAQRHAQHSDQSPWRRSETTGLGAVQNSTRSRQGDGYSTYAESAAVKSNTRNYNNDSTSPRSSSRTPSPPPRNSSSSTSFFGRGTTHNLDSRTSAGNNPFPTIDPDFEVAPTGGSSNSSRNPSSSSSRNPNNPGVIATTFPPSQQGNNGNFDSQAILDSHHDPSLGPLETSVSPGVLAISPGIDVNLSYYNLHRILTAITSGSGVEGIVHPNEIASDANGLPSGYEPNSASSLLIDSSEGGGSLLIDSSEGEGSTEIQTVSANRMTGNTCAPPAARPRIPPLDHVTRAQPLSRAQQMAIPIGEESARPNNEANVPPSSTSSTSSRGHGEPQRQPQRPSQNSLRPGPQGEGVQGAGLARDGVGRPLPNNNRGNGTGRGRNNNNNDEGGNNPRRNPNQNRRNPNQNRRNNNNNGGNGGGNDNNGGGSGGNPGGGSGGPGGGPGNNDNNDNSGNNDDDSETPGTESDTNESLTARATKKYWVSPKYRQSMQHLLKWNSRRAERADSKGNHGQFIPKPIWEMIASYLQFDGPLSNQIYVCGGRNQETGPLASAEVFDTWSGKWFPLPSMAKGRAGCAAAPIPGKYGYNDILVTGGYDKHGIVRGLMQTTESYCCVSNTWSFRAPLTRARWGHGAGTIRQKVYAVGGCSLHPRAPAHESFMETLRSCEIYDSTTDSWSAGPPLNTGRAGGRVTTVEDRYLMIVGGCDDVFGRAEMLKSIEIYDVESKNPVFDLLQTTLSEPRTTAATAGVGSKVLVFGGAPSMRTAEVIQTKVLRRKERQLALEAQSPSSPSDFCAPDESTARNRFCLDSPGRDSEGAGGSLRNMHQNRSSFYTNNIPRQLSMSDEELSAPSDMVVNTNWRLGNLRRWQNSNSGNTDYGNNASGSDNGPNNFPSSADNGPNNFPNTNARAPNINFPLTNVDTNAVLNSNLPVANGNARNGTGSDTNTTTVTNNHGRRRILVRRDAFDVAASPAAYSTSRHLRVAGSPQIGISPGAWRGQSAQARGPYSSPADSPTTRSPLREAYDAEDPSGMELVPMMVNNDINNSNVLQIPPGNIPTGNSNMVEQQPSRSSEHSDANGVNQSQANGDSVVLPTSAPARRRPGRGAQGEAPVKIQKKRAKPVRAVCKELAEKKKSSARKLEKTFSKLKKSDTTKSDKRQLVSNVQGVDGRPGAGIGINSSSSSSSAPQTAATVPDPRAVKPEEKMGRKVDKVKTSKTKASKLSPKYKQGLKVKSVAAKMKGFELLSKRGSAGGKASGKAAAKTVAKSMAKKPLSSVASSAPLVARKTSIAESQQSQDAHNDTNVYPFLCGEENKENHNNKNPKQNPPSDNKLNNQRSSLSSVLCEVPVLGNKLNNPGNFPPKRVSINSLNSPIRLFSPALEVLQKSEETRRRFAEPVAEPITRKNTAHSAGSFSSNANSPNLGPKQAKMSTMNGTNLSPDLLPMLDVNDASTTVDPSLSVEESPADSDHIFRIQAGNQIQPTDSDLDSLLSGRTISERSGRTLTDGETTSDADGLKRLSDGESDVECPSDDSEFGELDADSSEESENLDHHDESGSEESDDIEISGEDSALSDTALANGSDSSSQENDGLATDFGRHRLTSTASNNATSSSASASSSRNAAASSSSGSRATSSSSSSTSNVYPAQTPLPGLAPLPFPNTQSVPNNPVNPNCSPGGFYQDELFMETRAERASTMDEIAEEFNIGGANLTSLHPLINGVPGPRARTDSMMSNAHGLDTRFGAGGGPAAAGEPSSRGADYDEAYDADSDSLSNLPLDSDINDVNVGASSASSAGGPNNQATVNGNGNNTNNVNGPGGLLLPIGRPIGAPATANPTAPYSPNEPVCPGPPLSRGRMGAQAVVAYIPKHGSAWPVKPKHGRLCVVILGGEDGDADADTAWDQTRQFQCCEILDLRSLRYDNTVNMAHMQTPRTAFSAVCGTGYPEPLRKRFGWLDQAGGEADGGREED